MYHGSGHGSGQPTFYKDSEVFQGLEAFGKTGASNCPTHGCSTCTGEGRVCFTAVDAGPGWCVSVSQPPAEAFIHSFRCRSQPAAVVDGGGGPSPSQLFPIGTVLMLSSINGGINKLINDPR